MIARLPIPLPLVLNDANFLKRLRVAAGDHFSVAVAIEAKENGDYCIVVTVMK
jgi:hypothetical protein